MELFSLRALPCNRNRQEFILTISPFHTTSPSQRCF